GVEYGGLARPGGAVQEEDPGRGQRLEVDVLRVRERAEGRDGQAVQSHEATSRTASETRTSSNARCSTTRSVGSGPAPPRTWPTKSSAICWSVRPSRRRA